MAENSARWKKKHEESLTVRLNEIMDKHNEMYNASGLKWRVENVDDERRGTTKIELNGKKLI